MIHLTFIISYYSKKYRILVQLITVVE